MPFLKMPGLAFFILCLVIEPILSIRIDHYLRIIPGKGVWAPAAVLFRHRIHTLPNTRPRIIIPRAVIIQPCLLILLLPVEQIRDHVGIAVFVYEALWTACGQSRTDGSGKFRISLPPDAMDEGNVYRLVFSGDNSHRGALQLIRHAE